MDNLQLTDIPAIDGDGTGALGVLTTIFVIVSILSLVPSFCACVSMLGHEKSRPHRSRFLRFLSLSIALLIATCVIGTQQDAAYDSHKEEYRQTSVKIATQNNEVLTQWINSNYAVTVDEQDTTKLLGTSDLFGKNPTNIYGIRIPWVWESAGIIYSDWQDDQIQSVFGPIYVKSDDGEVLNVELVWDGDSYILLREGGGEVALRSGESN